MQLQPHQQRIVDEKTELDEKLSKLTTFVNSEKFYAIVSDEDERSRLVRQQQLMFDYSAILGERIAAFK